MTEPSLGRKKRKITITASPKGVEVAENALIRLGFDSKLNFAKSQLLARSTVTKFFHGEPIQLDSFKRICEALKLNWREIAKLPEQEQSERLEIKDYSPDTNEGVEPVQTLIRQVTVRDKESKKVKIEIKLKGDINLVHDSKILELVLREYSGDSIETTDIKEGSIRLFVEGSPEDIERLISRIKSGELKEVSGFPVEDVQILSGNSNDDESNELNDKWRLVQEIVTQKSRGRNLSGADLSDADLSNIDLSNANLRGADLSDADLSNTNLREADLSNANLRGANLIGANLSNANLRGANLRGVNLKGANLRGVNLIGADLRDAILRGVILIGVILLGANLIGAIQLSDDELKAFMMLAISIRMIVDDLQGVIILTSAKRSRKNR
jgi:Pentapeptide repeats (8 copies)